MKPNDKAIEAAIRYLEAPMSAREQMEQILTAAYAAQFQSEDYAGLVKELRQECRDWLTADCVAKAADALEALLAERDTVRKELIDEIKRLDRERIAWKKQQEETAALLKQVEAERDALLARLAPVDDEALVEIVAREIAFAQGDVESPNSEFMDENWHCWEPEARAAIAAIRPHIEAVERDRCAKKLDEACELLHKLTAIIPGNDGAGEEVAKFLRSATIRIGK